VKYARTDVKASQVADFIMPKKPLTILKNISFIGASGGACSVAQSVCSTAASAFGSASEVVA
jgi:hypothetical protein